MIRYNDKLPNLYDLMQKNNKPHLRSVFPQTRLQRGLRFILVLTHLNTALSTLSMLVQSRIHISRLHLMTAHLREEHSGMCSISRDFRAAVILPMNIKEGWDIDGLMITHPYEGKIRVYPQSKENIYNPRYGILGTDGKFTSEKDLPALRDEFFAKVNEEIRLTRLAIENEDVDVLFSYFSTTDGIQHDFWRHCDPNHPEYPGANEHENVIRDMYITMDNYVGEVMQKQPDTPLLIISDHGHGARPVYTVRINELLRRGGYLHPRGAEMAPSLRLRKKSRKLLKKQH